MNILFYADGLGQTILEASDDIDGSPFSWEVSDATGLLSIDGDEMANFTVENDTRWVANTPEGSLACDRRANSFRF